jgi:hypothetical protein
MEHNQIHFRAEFTIEEGKIEEYKKLIQEMSTVVEANEPDTLIAFRVGRRRGGGIS